MAVADHSICTRCGKPIKGKPVMVEYGDPGFEKKPQFPFALDAKCYEENREVTVAEWVNEPGDDGNMQPVLREFKITRYVKV